MSQKISAKNLHYDTSLPPFLARLRGQHEAQRSSGGPDPILAANRRPNQKRSASEQAEDAPLVVDEAGNVVDFALATEIDQDKQVGEEGKDSSGVEGINKDAEGDEKKKNSAAEAEKEKEKVAGIGASRKRKVGRVIGEHEQQSDDDDDEDDSNNNNNNRNNKKRPLKETDDSQARRIEKASADIRRLVDSDRETAGAQGKKQQQEEQNQGTTTIKSAKKNKKTAKKIKLSFGDDGV